MQDSNQLLDKINQQAASSQNTPIEAGQTEIPNKASTIDAINRIFAEFELVYHNQFNKAFASVEKLQFAKKLWLSHLQHIPAEQIIHAAHKAIKESEYLPTIRGILKFCDNEYELFGLPDVRSAYIEACSATAPQDQAVWSHAAVYYAGKASDWYFLANQPEEKTYPIFKDYYQQMCQRVRRGEKLELPVVKALPEKITEPPLTQEQQLMHLQSLRDSLNL